jgi:hypothetical protein
VIVTIIGQIQKFKKNNLKKLYIYIWQQNIPSPKYFPLNCQNWLPKKNKINKKNPLQWAMQS